MKSSRWFCVLSLALFLALIVLPSCGQTFTNFVSPAPGLIAQHGDFNNDGREDLLFLTLQSGAASANQWAVQVLVSTGDGTYAQGQTYNFPQLTFGAPTNPVIADFNNDGKLDFAIAGNNTIFVYFGNGDGTFRLGPALQVTNPSIQNLVAADLNGDSNRDLVVPTFNSFSNTSQLETFLSDGKGSFSKGPVSQLGSTNPSQLVTGDFDGDGNADVAAADCNGTTCSLTVAYGDGNGSFGPFFNINTPEALWTVADVNGDTRSDLLGKGVGSSFPVIYGQANRSLTVSQIPIAQCSFGFNIAVADFNGDGIPDLILGEGPCSGQQVQSNTQMAFKPGLGGGNFGPEQFFFSFNIPSANGADAFAIRGNADTLPDLAFTENEQPGGQAGTLHVMLNNDTGTFPKCTAPNTAVGLNICAPTGSSASASPVAFSVGASGPSPMRKVAVFADGKKVGEQFAHAFSQYSFLDNSIALANGSHSMQVFADGWDGWKESKSFTLQVGPTTTGSFTLTAANGSQTVTAGQTATYNLTLAAVNGFAGNVSLACSGAPAGATCSLNPASAALSASTTSVPVTVTVNTSMTAGLNSSPVGNSPGGGSPFGNSPVALAGLFGGVIFGLGFGFRRRSRMLMLLAIAVLAVGMVACAGGRSHNTSTPGNQPVTATLTVTASSGSASASIPLGLTIK